MKKNLHWVLLIASIIGCVHIVVRDFEVLKNDNGLVAVYIAFFLVLLSLVCFICYGISEGHKD